MGLRSQGPVNELGGFALDGPEKPGTRQRTRESLILHDRRIPISQPLSRPPLASSLADVIDTILDKGLVIDMYVRVSLVGIELLTIDARIVIASVDTYLRFAKAVNRLDHNRPAARSSLNVGG